MKNFLKRTWAEINLDALLHNFNTIRNFAKCDIAAVVKADAYGHGAKIVSKVLPARHTKLLAVATLEEAIELRLAKNTKPILILGHTPADYSYILKQYDLIQTIHSIEYARELSERAVSYGVTFSCHIKIDTGMSRIGFNCRDDGAFSKDELLECASLKNLSITGIYTHFATADRSGDQNGEFTKAQFERFTAVCKFLEENGVAIKCKHCCNSAAIMLDEDKHLDMSRLGIMLYGLTPDTNLELTLPIEPVMTLKTLVTQVKQIKKGDCVSYGRTFKAEKDMTVATLSVGYADGYPRSLSNRGEVIIRGKRAKIIGTVCMDQIVVDVSDIDGVKPEDEVVLFGKDLSVDEIAKLCGTINYEIVCGISRRVPRVYYKNGKIYDVINYLN